MSASLVGSEMCIRDRQKNRFAKEPVRQDRLAKKPVRRRPARQRLVRRRPVSYTHLTLPTICSV
eukprot:11370974-Alexandrium_andersonii.AAC.1